MSVHCDIVFGMLNCGYVGNVYVSESFKGCCPVYPRLTYPSYTKDEILKASHVIFYIFGLKFHNSSKELKFRRLSLKIELKFHRQSSKIGLKFHRNSLKIELKFHRQSSKIGLKFHSLSMKIELKFHRHNLHILAETIRIYLLLS